uniref:Serine aminopeptidase S33 domain-containing protein n=1 Tax=Leersia perrieri TaxID=77586 RepID=A0A0D9V0W0_9ORYZ
MATLSLPLHSQIVLWRPRRRHDLFERISCHHFKHDSWRLQARYKGLETMYDDGYQKAKDLDYYYKSLGELVEHDSGPPRMFCPVDAGKPIEDAPLMLYLPGVDGMGMGLFMHHKALGRIFELRCMHIPFRDRTPFEELVTMVEDVVRAEYATSPNKPIYLLGSSFGGCIALAVAARNPCIDLILVLANPATSFQKSDIKQLLSVSSPLSDRARIAITSLLNYNIDNEVDMALSSMKSGTHPLEALNRLTNNISSFLKHSNILDKIPEDTLEWKLKLIEQAASYANCRLESVSAEVLLLISCADRLLPSKSEAERLQRKLPKCKIYFFENHGHSLLLEYGVHVSSIIKSTGLYRHSRRHHRIFDYIPPSVTELKEVDKASSDLRLRTSPAMFSTLEDGTVVRGLAGVPEEGPVLLVGNHMLLGIELISLAAEFLRRKRLVLRGIAHPLLFPNKTKTWSEGHDFFDFLNLWGGVPMTYKYIYQLLAAGEFVLLYPGGHREALHCKGEEHTLFWPDQTEFVRMAAQFNATIVPFGVVGEDDLMELLCTFDDIKNAPFGKELMQAYSNHLKLRDVDHEVFFPGVYLKIPGRFYYRFGKPIATRRRQEVITDKKAAGELYLHVKSEVQAMIAYLLEKREEDKFRSILPRMLYQFGWGPVSTPPIHTVNVISNQRASPPLFHMSMSIALHTILPPAAAPCLRRRHLRRRRLLRASPTGSPAAAASGEKGKEATADRKRGSRRRMTKKVDEVGLDPLYDDGFGEITIRDYFQAVRAMPLDGGGPPRWFCPVDCGAPAVDGAPLLLFLPGIDGVGMELNMQHKSLGRVFEVRCFHIPVNDRTPYEGLLQILEESVKREHDLSPNRPIYITGDSFVSAHRSPPLFHMSIALHAVLPPAAAPCLRRRRSLLRASIAGSPAASREKGKRGRRRRRTTKKVDELGLDPLYDDGFGEITVRDYFEAVRAMPLDGGGPPRWFCPVDCGEPAVDGAPLLLFLPGIDGVGMELIMQHKSLGRVFEVRCLHIPVNDRTPYEGLLQILEESVKREHDLSPNRPIYIIGDSFGGCLALSLAARNPEINLVLILAILPLLEMVPSNLPVTLPHLLRYLIGDPLKMAMVSIQSNSSPQEILQSFSYNLASMLPLLSEFGNTIQMDTLVWKLKLLKSGAEYTNSHLHAVQGEVLLLASGNDNLPPSGEAERLFKTLKSCKVRYFRTSSDRLLMEGSFNLLTVIKGASMYRMGKQRDTVTDFLPPTLSEFKRTYGEDFKPLHDLLSPVILSTLSNGKIVRGLAGVPDKGPVLLVGYHQLLAMEITSMAEEFLREKKAVLRTLAHPVYFVGNYEILRQEISFFDIVPLYGGVQVSPINTYRLFERDEFVLLYPGGIREALHRKGEDYQLFWPDQPEFVRMAAQFGVTVIPFGCVGEDDILEIILDYNDIKNIPCIRESIESFNQDCPGVRSTVKGEEGNQVLHLPAVLPKLPGRLYYLFGKPIEMKGMDGIDKDRESANQLYLDMKLEVENIMSYLKRKRQQDPYRSITARTLYQATWGASAQIPTFEP